MKPLDPRLLRYARSARSVLGFGGLLGTLRTLAVIAWCWFLAHALTALALPALQRAGLNLGPSDRTAEGAPAADALLWLVGAAAIAVLVRSLTSWGMDVVAARGAVRVKAQLRSAALDAIDRRPPAWLAHRADSGPSLALGRGLDALDGYFSAYLPQLILTACATPLLVLAVLLADPLSGVVVIIVFPVIPIFMVLIGLATRTVQDRQWTQLQHLSRSFLDVVEGLTTLKLYGREQRQIDRIARETGEYRQRTMQVLRVTFLSGFVLDLAGTFSIALVAVTVGTRLVTGEFPLALGLFVLLLLPEAFMPIRAVGSAFHSSTEGLAAAEQVFEIIEWQPAAGNTLAATAASAANTPTGSPESLTAISAGAPSSPPIPRSPETLSLADRSAASPVLLSLSNVTVARDGQAVIGPVSFEIEAGEMVAFAGPSGSGKSTLIGAILHFLDPSTGEIVRPAIISWVGQRPGLLQGTVSENIALGEATTDSPLVQRALEAVGLHALAPERQLGVLGSGLSGGQAQRVAIARCLYRAWVHDAGLLVLDEPSSALDAASERLVAEALRAEARAGRAVLVVSHRSALLAAADRTVHLASHTEVAP